MAKRNSSGERIDPVLTFNFVISLLESSSTVVSVSPPPYSNVLDDAIGGFNECSGIEMTLEVEEYKEGGRNGEVLKFPTRVSWSNISLKKGLVVDATLWDWSYSFVRGQGERRDGVIVLLDELRSPHTMWQFRRGLPLKYTGPTMNATQSNVAIEALEISHEGIIQIPIE